MTFKYKNQYLVGLEILLKSGENEISGKNWKVLFKDLRKKEDDIGSNWGLQEMDSRGNFRKSKFFIIAADNKDVARKAVELIWASWMLIQGSSIFDIDPEEIQLIEVKKVYKLPFDLYKKNHFAGDAGGSLYAASLMAIVYYAGGDPTNALRKWQSDNAIRKWSADDESFHMGFKERWTERKGEAPEPVIAGRDRFRSLAENTIEEYFGKKTSA